MKTPIKVKKGLGKPVNPHLENMPEWHNWERLNIPFPCIDQNNNPVDSFEGDGELRYQYLHVGKFWKFCDSEAQYEKMKASGFAFTRQVWLIEVAGERGTVDYVAEKYANEHYGNDGFSRSENWENGKKDFLAGAKYTSSNSIDRRNLQDAKNIAECLQQVIDMGMVHFDNEDDETYLPRLIELLKTL